MRVVYERIYSYMNLVDTLIILALLLYIFIHASEGVLSLTRRLLGFVGGAAVGFLIYADVSQIMAPYVSLSSGMLDALAFIICFVLVQWVINLILKNIFSLFPQDFESSRVSKALAVLPAAVDGIILISLVLFIIAVSPFFLSAKGPIEKSKIGSDLVDKASEVEVYIDKVFGNAAHEGFGFLTVEPAEGESVNLPYKPRVLKIDANAEAEMLILVNEERAKVGVAPLVADETLRAVARANSKDMWERQYFAHVNPDGLDPFERMEKGGAIFRTAGENLALARTVERAHEGLMNSPGHKRNILDPSFKRVGIGVIDGGVYGQMYTQNFSD
jgi:uncharacterized membrane protein required for colicin V production